MKEDMVLCQTTIMLMERGEQRDQGSNGPDHEHSEFCDTGSRDGERIERGYHSVTHSQHYSTHSYTQ